MPSCCTCTTRALRYYLELLLSEGFESRSITETPRITSEYFRIHRYRDQIYSSSCQSCQTTGHLLAGVFNSELYRAIIKMILTGQESRVFLSTPTSAIDRCVCVLCEPYGDNANSLLL